MLTSKRQEWILQLIKGPDLTPVGSCAGHYTTKCMIQIMAHGHQSVIHPTDVLDLSHSEYLSVQTPEGAQTISWNEIEGMEFDEQVLVRNGYRSPASTRSPRIFPFSLGKKVV
jgi:hypothetical protein